MPLKLGSLCYMTMQFRGLLKGVEKGERHTGKEGGRCRKVGDRGLRSGEEKRCSQDSFAVRTLAAPG